MSETASRMDEAVPDIALRLYGHNPRVERFWSEVNHVLRLRFDDQLPDKVIKFGRDDTGRGILREQAILRNLAAAGLPVPPIEFTQQDYPAAPAPFTIMPRVCERTLGELYHAGPTGEGIRPLFSRLGELLARVHCLDAGLLDGAATRQEGWQRERDICRRNRQRAVRHGLEMPGGDDLLQRIAQLIERGPGGFVHNDMHPGNIMTDGQDVFVAIDWENAGEGYVLRDLGRCLASARVWFGHEEEILKGYTQVRAVTDSEGSELAAWRSYALFDFAIFYAQSGRKDDARNILAMLDRQVL